MSVSKHKHVYAQKLNISKVHEGTKLKVREFEWFERHYDAVMHGVYLGTDASCGAVMTVPMSHWCGKEVTVTEKIRTRMGWTEIYLKETGHGICWDPFMFENFEDFYTSFVV